MKTSRQRIVSLIPSATELLFSLGVGDQLVGVSHECDFPASVKDLPVCTEANVDPHAHGKKIDGDIRDLVRRGLGIYRIKLDVLESLRPDLILTQDQCEVCAVSLRDVEDAVGKLTHHDVKICSLKPHSLADTLRDFERVGDATRSADRARSLIHGFKDRLEGIGAKASKLSAPRVAAIEWLDPPMIGGGWIPELIKIAGGQPTLVTEPERFRQVNWDEIRAAAPEIITLFPCGFSVEKTLADLSTSAAAENLRGFAAVKNGKCFVCDGNAFFNRPGPRLVESCEILASLFHPEAFGDLLPRYRKAFVAWS